MFYIMHDIVIRRATKDDRYIYAQCLSNNEWRQLYGMNFSNRELNDVLDSFAPLNSHELRCFICETNNSVVGFVNLLLQDNGDIVMAGGVLPKLREVGFGVVFYAHMISYAMGLSTTKRIVVQVENANDISLKMQQYFGFAEEGEILNTTKRSFVLTRKAFLDRTVAYQNIIDRYSCEVQDG